MRGRDIAAVAHDMDEECSWPNVHEGGGIDDVALDLEAPTICPACASSDVSDPLDQSRSLGEFNEMCIAGHFGRDELPKVGHLEAEAFALTYQLDAQLPARVGGRDPAPRDSWIARQLQVAALQEMMAKVAGQPELQLRTEDDIRVRVQDKAHQSGAGAVIAAEKDGW
jgi:hypothetical protein